MEAVRTSETSAYYNKTTRRNIPEGSNIHTRYREKFKSHNTILNTYKVCVFILVIYYKIYVISNLQLSVVQRGNTFLENGLFGEYKLDEVKYCSLQHKRDTCRQNSAAISCQVSPCSATKYFSWLLTESSGG
jgi:hypothetical protein